MKMFVATFVAGTVLLTGCSAGTAEEVRKAENYCKQSVPQDASEGAFGTNPDPAQFKRDVEEAFDHCVDIRIDYYKDHPEAP